MWDFCAWVGIAAFCGIALGITRFVVESALVARVGWARLKQLGFWRSLALAVTTGPPWRIY